MTPRQGQQQKLAIRGDLGHTAEQLESHDLGAAVFAAWQHRGQIHDDPSKILRYDRDSVHRLMSHSRRHQFGITLLRLIRILPFLGVVRRVTRAPEKLFHTEYYVARNPDVESSWIPPLLHFLLFGAFERRRPNPLFDPEFYLRTYTDVAHTQTNPLLHYLKYGAAEGRRPHPLFTPDPDAGSPLAQFLRSLSSSPEVTLYSWWKRQEIQLIPPRLATVPRFSILLAISEPCREWLQAAISSVRTQSYSNWELHIGINSAAEAWVTQCVDEAAKKDVRIHVHRVDFEGPTAAVLNQLSTKATGEYLTILHQSDQLAIDALHWVAAKLPAELIYSDEDRLDSAGIRMQPLFKPNWSPDLLLSCMYIGRMLIISRRAWDDAGGYRIDYDGALDYDLALRVTENTVRVQHVPRILYSRRDGAGSGEDNAAAKRSLADALRRRRIPAEIEAEPRPGTFRLLWQPSNTALVSIIICSRSPELLERCIDSLNRRTTYPRYEVVVVQHLDRRAGEVQDVIARHHAFAVPYSGPFHFSRMNNLGAAAATGSILLFLNDDTEALERSWLSRLAAQVERPAVGVAGAQLVYPSGTLQHGGVAIGIGDGCGHLGRDSSALTPRWPWLHLTRDVSAVTGACMAIQASVFNRLGGFAEEFPVNYNDIDLCLRARAAGYRVIYEAGAVLRHHECQTRQGIVTPQERRRWNQRWELVIKAGDPFYSPNLSHQYEDLSLESPFITNPTESVHLQGPDCGERKPPGM
jgi:GT2 family glycosyltransferase